MTRKELRSLAFKLAQAACSATSRDKKSGWQYFDAGKARDAMLKTLEKEIPVGNDNN